MVEALFVAVADRAVREQRRVASPARIEKGFFPPHIEKALLLAGKARVG
jgi:hypothetical protein